MDNLKYIKDYLDESISVKKLLQNSEDVLKQISLVADIIINAYKNGNKVILAGNGGSAADSQHIAAEFVSRFFFDRPGLPAIALTTDTSMLTAIGNDYGFDKLFERQLQAQSKPGDVFIGISTSGNSGNIIKAMNITKELGVISVALCGSAGMLKDIVDYPINVPSKITPYIQECHICIGHMICAIVEKAIFKPEEN
ncbi:SIS domain-containing protein [Cedecea sp. FDAARGOS_727]|uniref:D-sedoheptulose-7-phosphate isomerase n=1 Tax=Cedecea sp. FDAARGOS_727 TaxID=2545798 RepID=UPI00143ED954|nr:D-sedoheptulose 7-phosphate isomerase [Cedecea sp. FDAARGOS_727]QIX97184.1 D-sedoheptulose 7-phosphate isomerase [Cedecea sp. FDAARGOS_727]